MGCTPRVSIRNHTESSSTGATDLDQVLRGFYEILSTNISQPRSKCTTFQKFRETNTKNNKYVGKPLIK